MLFLTFDIIPHHSLKSGFFALFAENNNTITPRSWLEPRNVIPGESRCVLQRGSVLKRRAFRDQTQRFFNGSGEIFEVISLKLSLARRKLRRKVDSSILTCHLILT